MEHNIALRALLEECEFESQQHYRARLGRLFPQFSKPRFSKVPTDKLAPLIVDNGDRWMKFVLTGQPAALADYLENGGEFDAEVRALVVTILRGEIKPDNRSGKNSWEDYLTYIAVEKIMRGKRLGFGKACDVFRTTDKLHSERRTTESRYHRGKKLFEGKKL